MQLINKKNFEVIHYLRFISILAVVLFHAGVSGFNLGWLGVDVFLVVSGFLMQAIYSNSLIKLEVAGFYTRRLKRLLPSFLITQFLFFSIFFLVTLPFERKLLAEQFAFGLLISSNIGDWISTNYFSADLLNPTLNFWSLALELQFYLIFPLITRFLRNLNIRIITFLTLATTLGWFFSEVSSSASFYILPGRVWEFYLGVLAYQFSIQSVRVRMTTSIFVFFLIIAMTFSQFVSFFLSNNFMKQLIACLLSFSILISFPNFPTSYSNFARTVRFISRYSYEIYLVHLPILVLLTYKPFQGNLNSQISLNRLPFALFLTLLLSILLSRAARYLQTNFKFSRVVPLLMIVSVVTLIPALCFPSIRNLGYSKFEISISEAREDRAVFRCGIFYRVQVLHESSDTCYVGNYVRGRDEVLLVGNSHADAIKSSLAQVLNRMDFNLRILSENDPINSNNLAIYLLAVNGSKYSAVIMSNRADSVNIDSLRVFVSTLKNRDVPLYLILPLVEIPFDVPSKMYEDLRGSGKISVQSRISLEQVSSSYNAEISKLKSIGDKDSVLYIDPNPVLCAPMCAIADESTGSPYFFDNNHLTLTGARNLEDLFAEKLKPLVTTIHKE